MSKKEPCLCRRCVKRRERAQRIQEWKEYLDKADALATYIVSRKREERR